MWDPVAFILTLQVSGFAAMVVLWILTLFGHAIGPNWFMLSFAVHFAGDILFLKKEGFPVSLNFGKLEKSFLSRVKLLPWSQFAFTWFAVLSLFVFALGGYKGFLPGTARIGAFAGADVALVAFWISILKGQKVPGLQRLLEFGGLGAAAVLAYFLSKGTLIPCFVALAVSQAGQWFDSIYP